MKSTFQNVSGFPFSLDPAGCGNSSMSADMYSAGYHSITNVDYSSVCISTMRARHSDCPGMTWHEMDIRQLSFPDASFDIILEKATLDAIMVEEKSPWELSAQTACFIQKALTEVRYCSKNDLAVSVQVWFHFPPNMSGNRDSEVHLFLCRVSVCAH